MSLSHCVKCIVSLFLSDNDSMVSFINFQLIYCDHIILLFSNFFQMNDHVQAAIKNCLN